MKRSLTLVLVLVGVFMAGSAFAGVGCKGHKGFLKGAELTVENTADGVKIGVKVAAADVAALQDHLAKVKADKDAGVGCGCGEGCKCGADGKGCGCADGKTCECGKDGKGCGCGEGKGKGCAHKDGKGCGCGPFCLCGLDGAAMLVENAVDGAVVYISGKDPAAIQERFAALAEKKAGCGKKKEKAGCGGCGGCGK